MERWSAEQLAALIAEYPKRGTALRETIGRSGTAIKKKAKRMGVCAEFHKKRKLTPRRIA